MTQNENLKQWIQGLNVNKHLKNRMLKFIKDKYLNDINGLTGFISCLFLTELITLEEHDNYFEIVIQSKPL